MAERGNRLLRTLDDRLGPALLRLTACTRRPSIDVLPPRRIGVMCLGALGDLLLLSAVKDDLSRAHPKADIIFIGSSSNAAIAPLLDLPDFITLPVSRPDKALRILRSLKLDFILDSSQWARLPALLCAFSKARTVGFKTPGQNRHFAYDMVVEHQNDQHEIENFRALAATLVTTSGARPKLKLSQSDHERVAALNRPPYAVLHAWPSGAQAHLKEWPQSSWIDLAKRLTARGLHIVLTGAPVDVDRSQALSHAIGAMLDDSTMIHNLTGKLRLSETAALLEAAQLTVSVNTGIMHMAATFPPPLVGLSGPTNPLRWGPLSPHARSPKPNCDNCHYLNLGFEYPDTPPDCMGAISVDAVMTALDEFA